MSKEFKVPRAIVEIQQEYQSICTRAGDLQYRVATMQKDLTVLNEQLRDLNFEAVSSKEFEDKKAAETKQLEEKKASEEAKEVKSE